MEQSPLAVELLTVLGQSEAAPTIEIGGGIALWVSSPHWSTNDIDAWWPAENDVSRAAITSAVDQVAARKHCQQDDGFGSTWRTPDFVNVATVLRSGLLTDSECWRLWMLKKMS